MPVIQLGEGGRVSIQLVSPARGEPQQNTRNSDRDSVSIQLVSPARGEHGRSVFLLVLQICFHSIGFPCERGTFYRKCHSWQNILSFHSIGFPCERGTNHRIATLTKSGKFPFNWFPLREGNSYYVWEGVHAGGKVSIQLVSPARGEPFQFCQPIDIFEFPFNWFPLREGNNNDIGHYQFQWNVSIQLVSPARGELEG